MIEAAQREARLRRAARARLLREMRAGQSVPLPELADWLRRRHPDLSTDDAESIAREAMVMSSPMRRLRRVRA